MVINNERSVILKVEDLVTRIYTPEGIVHAVNGVTFDLASGETLGVVGESGCGKSVTKLSVLQLIASPPGKIEKGHAWFEGKDLLELPIDYTAIVQRNRPSTPRKNCGDKKSNDQEKKYEIKCTSSLGTPVGAYV